MAVKQQKRTQPLQVRHKKPVPREQVKSYLERHARVLAVVLVIFASARIVATYDVFSHTADEPAHIACGMEWLDQGVYTWEPQHPPLARIAAALGPYLSGIRSQNTPRNSVEAFSLEGIDILEAGGRYDRTLSLARLGILPFFWIACLVVFLWARRYFGAAAAVAAVFLFSFVPSVLAHAGLATTDMAVTALLGAAFLAAIVWLEEPTPAHAGWFGLAGGLAVVSKFSALAFFPAAAAAALTWYFIAERPGLSQTFAAVRDRLPTFAMAVAITCLVVWAVYRFSFGKVAGLGLSLPAPELWQGIRDVASHNAKGQPAFLLGERSYKGFWDFFPVAIAVKTPLAFLALLAIGIVASLRHKLSCTRPYLPVAFSGAILAVAMASNINIGLRHILPMYVAFAVLAGAGLVYLLELRPTPRWSSPLLAVLCGWLAVSSLLAHPDYIPYFNELAGSHPETILVDSDLDWGQDMKRLGKRLREVGAKQLIYVSHFKTDLHQFGFPPVTDKMNVLRPDPGWTAVSLTALKQRRMGLGDNYPQVVPWPNLVPPTEKIGKSIWLYYFPGNAAVQ